MVKSLSFVVCVADREDYIITALILWENSNKAIAVKMVMLTSK